MQADPIGILKDYSDPMMQVATRAGISLGGVGGGLNHLYGYVDGNPISYVDPFGLLSPWGWSDRAETEAENSGLAGQHNGEQDAYRHCVASCMLASSNWGNVTAVVAGWANEASNLGQSDQARAMDDWNNQVGRCLATNNSDPENCTQSCTNALQGGALTTNGGTDDYY